MSDPFDPLRRSDDGTAPDIDAIRSRARRVVRRRYVGVAAGAAVLVLLAGVVLLAGPGTRDTTEQLAQQRRFTATPTVAVTVSPSPGAEAEAAVDGDSRTAAPAPREREAPIVVPPDPDPPPREPSPEGLEVALQVSSAGRSAQLTLSACNRGASPVVRDFFSGQRYDFEVSRDGRAVWRWSDDKFFTQEIGQERWGPGECKRWTEAWDGTDSRGRPAPAGAYEAVGILTSDPPQRTGPRAFCLEAC